VSVFRNNSEPDPMPAANAQLAAEPGEKQPGSKTAFATGQDAGLSQSLADLRKGYQDAARVQSDADQQATLNRAMADAKIDANVPRTSVQFIDHRPEQYIAGDSSQVPSSDPSWRIPLDHLRENLQLTEATFGAVDRLTKTGSQKDFQIAAELGERLQQSMARDFPPQQVNPQQQEPQNQPQLSAAARPETFPDGEVVHVTQNPDGTLSAEYITGERFSGDPLTITQQIAKSHIQTKKWAQQQRAQAQQPQSGNGNTQPLIPSSEVQYDPQYDSPMLEPGQSAIPDEMYGQLNRMATLLGYTDANEMVNDQLALRNKTEQIAQDLQAEKENRQNHEAAAVFLAQNPDFPNNEQSINALDQIIARNNLEWSPENMAMAHTYAVKNGLYQPLSLEAQQQAAGLAVQAQRPTPPPMIRSNSPESGAWQSGHDPQTMPLAELRRLAIQQELQGKDSSVSYR
jgi:hypothetical protein